MQTSMVPVVFSVNNTYAYYCYLAIFSLIKHANKKRKYDIRVLVTDLSDRNRKLLEELSISNVSVKCMNITEITNGANLRGISFLSVETYYRLFIPLLMKEYDKVLYLDSDILILRDIADLYDTDLDGFMAGFVKDVETDWLESHDQALAGLDYRKCFNAGVFLLDCRKFEQEGIRDKALALLHEDYKRDNRLYIYADQDLLQITLHDKVLFLDDRWNFQFQYLWRKEVIYDQCREKYEKTWQDPWIIHYAGDRKPWVYPEIEGASYFWQVAKSSSVFEAILIEMAQINRRMKKVERNTVFRFPFEQVEGKSRVALYGAGKVGQDFYRQLTVSKYAKLVLWVDKNYEKINATNEENEDITVEIKTPSMLAEEAETYDFLVLAVAKKEMATELLAALRKQGMDEKKIIWADYHLPKE